MTITPPPVRRHRGVARIMVRLLVIATVAGMVRCTADSSPVAPPNPSDLAHLQLAPSHIPDPPTISGSPAALPLQGDAFERIDWTPTGLTVPSDGLFLIVRVEGGISVGENPEYTAYYCGLNCNLPLAGTTVGPQGAPETGGEFGVGIRIGGQTLGFQSDTSSLAMEFTGVVFQAGEVFYSRRNGGPAGGCTSDPIALGCPPGVGGLADHGASGYLIDGEQTLSIRAINPLEVHGSPSTVLIDPATGQADRTVGFTAESELSMTDTRWYYRAGDTLSTPAGRGGAGEIGLPCALSPSCSYRPPASGRMYARAQVAGNTVESHSEVVWVRADTLELIVSGAPDSVTQGDTVTFSSVDNFSGQNQRWTWVLEDTTAQPGLAGEVGHCGGESSCAYAPAATGRMHLAAFNAAGDSASAVSNLITVAPDVCAAAQSANGKLVAASEGTCEEELELRLTMSRSQLEPRRREYGSRSYGWYGLDERVRIVQPLLPEGRTDAHVTVLRNDEPVEGVQVTLDGTFLADPVSHRHIDEDVSFAEAPIANRDQSGPVSGYFETSGGRLPAATITTDQGGGAETVFAAGHISGVVRIAASAEVDGEPLTDEVEIDIGVPLTYLPAVLDAHGTPLRDRAYWVGRDHPYPLPTLNGVGQNWFAHPQAAGLFLGLLDAITPEPAMWVLQVNDASIAGGGAFRVKERASDDFWGELDDPWRAHRSHKSGVDVDLGWCMVRARGIDIEERARVSPSRPYPKVMCEDSQVLDFRELRAAAGDVFGVVLLEGDHPHVTFLVPGISRATR